MRWWPKRRRGFDLCSADNEQLRPLYALAIDWRRKTRSGPSESTCECGAACGRRASGRRCRARGESGGAAGHASGLAGVAQLPSDSQFGARGSGSRRERALPSGPLSSDGDHSTPARATSVEQRTEQHSERHTRGATSANTRDEQSAGARGSHSEAVPMTRHSQATRVPQTTRNPRRCIFGQRIISNTN